MSKQPMPHPSMLYRVRADSIVHGSDGGAGGAACEFFDGAGIRVLVITPF
jgi:hypothetical protein